MPFRAATDGADPPTFTPRSVDCVLRVFTPVTSHDVMTLTKSLPDKHCASDPLPTWLPKDNIELLAPFYVICSIGLCIQVGLYYTTTKKAGP